MKYFFWLVLILCGLALFLWQTYDFVYSDVDLLTKETALSYAERDVLGNRLYKETCTRSSYLEKIEVLSNGDVSDSKSGGFAFKFHPKLGVEKECPAVIVVVSRYTGEAWVTNVEK